MQSSSLFAWIALAMCLVAVRMESHAEPQLAPGDELRITFADRPELNTSVRLAADGSASVPPLGRVRLAGLTRILAETYVAERLLPNGAVNAAQVDIEVLQGGPLRLAEGRR